MVSSTNDTEPLTHSNIYLPNAGTLSFLQEILASHLAGVPVPQPAKSAPLPMHILAQAKITPKAFKMALYGFFVSAPLSHYLVGALQRQFAGKTSMGAKIGQVLASNLIVAPIQTLGTS